MKRFALVIAAALIALTGCASEPPPVSQKVQDYYDHGPATASATASTPAAKPVSFTTGTRTLFFGDSWTFGMSAEPVTAGFAYDTAKALQLDATVKGGPGTGYENRSTSGEGTFSERLAKLPADLNPQLVIVQGSINDANQDQAGLPKAARMFIVDLKAKYPAAQIVMIGPAPSAVPVDPALPRMDDQLRQVALDNKLNYISPVAEQWITAANVGTVIDPTTSHPSTAGHAFLASKTVDALNKLKDQKVKSVAFLGDSFTHGDGAATGKGWADVLAGLRGWQGKNFGFGGTGYATAGTLAGGQPYAARVDAIVAAKPDMVIVAGGGNDRAAPEPALKNGITDTLNRLHSGLPDAKIVVISPWVLKSEDEMAVARVTADVQAVATSIGATYVDIPNPVLGHADLIINDGVHPNDAGHAAIADAVNKALPAL